MSRPERKDYVLSTMHSLQRYIIALNKYTDQLESELTVREVVEYCQKHPKADGIFIARLGSWDLLGTEDNREISLESSYHLKELTEKIRK